MTDSEIELIWRQRDEMLRVASSISSEKELIWRQRDEMLRVASSISSEEELILRERDEVLRVASSISSESFKANCSSVWSEAIKARRLQEERNGTRERYQHRFPLGPAEIFFAPNHRGGSRPEPELPESTRRPIGFAPWCD